MGVTSIFLGCKYEEIYPMRLQTLQEKVAHKTFSIKQIKAMEVEIMKTLNYNLTIPNCFDLAQISFNQIGLNNYLIEDFAKSLEDVVAYLYKMVLHHYEIISGCRDSVITAGLIFVGIKIMEQVEENLCSEKMVFF